MTAIAILLASAVLGQDAPLARGELAVLKADRGRVPACVSEESYGRFRAAIGSRSGDAIRRLFDARDLTLLAVGTPVSVVEPIASPLAGDLAPGPAVVVKVPGRTETLWVPSLYARRAGAEPSYFETWMPAFSPSEKDSAGVASLLAEPGLGTPGFWDDVTHRAPRAFPGGAPNLDVAPSRDGPVLSHACGAATADGTPCQRRVAGAFRCWQHGFK